MKNKFLVLLMMVPALSLASIWDEDYAGAKWHTNYQQALALAAEKNLPVLVYFSGSDWCKFCIRLDKKILTREEFQQYANENLILVNLDFPAEKKLPADLKTQNDAMARRFSVKGFPMLVLVDAKTDTQVGEAMGCFPIICSERSFIKKISKNVAEYQKQ